MAEKIFTNVRLGLKIDTLAHWNDSTIGLKKGELAFATVAASAGTGLTEPVVMVKIGEDGVKTFKDLDFNFYAKASDVLSACKSESALKAFINGVIADAGIATNDALKALSDKVTANETAIGKLNGDAETEGSVAKAIADAITALKLDETYEKAGAAAAAEGRVNATIGTVTEGKTVVQMIEAAQEAATYDDTELAGRVTTAEGKITTLIGDDADKSVRTIANEELATQLIPENAGEALNTLKEIADWIQAHPGDASAMNTAITALQNKLVLGADEEGVEYATVKAYVEAAIAALKIGDYATAAALSELAGRVTTLEGKVTDWDGAVTKAGANETAISVLNGDAATEGSVAKTVADAIAALDVEDAAVENQFITAVSETDGKIAVSRATLNTDTIAQGELEIVFDCGGSGVENNQ